MSPTPNPNPNPNPNPDQVWCGDLNYRIDREREQVIQHVSRRAYKLLYAHDQLQAEMRLNNVFYGFTEVEPRSP